MSNLMQISADEREQYGYIPRQKKVDAMELYLLGQNGYFYNMEEVGEACFGNGNESFTVSLIHRANGINCGRGSTMKGLYRPGCPFEKKYGYRVTRRDIEDFIRQFEPTGSAYQGISFDEWLLDRAMKVGQSQAERQAEPYVSQSPVWTADESSFSGQEPKQDIPDMDGAAAVAVGIVILIGIILIIIFRKAIWAFLLKVLRILLFLLIAVLVVKVIIKLIKS